MLSGQTVWGQQIPSRRLALIVGQRWLYRSPESETSSSSAPAAPFVAYDPVVGTLHVQTFQGKLHQRRLDVRSRHDQLKLFGATRIPTHFRAASTTATGASVL